MASKRPNALLSLFVWLLPASRMKNWALRRLGHEIGDNVSIAPIIVMRCGTFRIGQDCVIEPLNLLRYMALVELGRQVYIGRFNQITAAPGYQVHSDKVGALIMGDNSLITHRQYLDCSGQVIIGRNSIVGGLKTIIQSHELDVLTDRVIVGKVSIGECSLTGTRCLLLPDSSVPPYSVLAAGSVLPRRRSQEQMKSGLYAGSPAKFVRDLPDLEFWKTGGGIPKVPQPFDDSVFSLEGN